MSFAVGERASAFRINNLQPHFHTATGSANLTTSGVLTDITGATVTFDTVTAGAGYTAYADFCYDVVVATTERAEGALLVDGVAASARARWSGEVTTDFGMASQNWTGTIAAAGSHTVKLQANRSGAAGQIDVIAAFTKFTIVIFEVV